MCARIVPRFEGAIFKRKTPPEGITRRGFSGCVPRPGGAAAELAGGLASWKMVPGMSGNIVAKLTGPSRSPRWGRFFVWCRPAEHADGVSGGNFRSGEREGEQARTEQDQAGDRHG